MTAQPILARYLREPNEEGAVLDIPTLGVVGIVATITQTFSLTVVQFLEPGEWVSLPKDTPVFLDPCAEDAIGMDADRRWVFASSRALMAQAGLFPTIDGGAS